jgi:hypothetical protein
MTSSELGTAPPPTFPDNLLSDEQVAKVIGFSVAYLRKQRFLRRKGQPHAFTLDSILIGGTPRYRASDLTNWLASL